METIELDIRGQICPSCLLLTLKQVNQHAEDIRAGNMRVCVVTDDRQSINTIPATVAKMGYRAEVSDIGDAYRIAIGPGG